MQIAPKCDIMKSAKNLRFGRNQRILVVFLMYIASNSDQLTIEDFFMPFGGKLLKSNRWVKLAAMMPWERIEQIYMASFQSENGRPAIPARIAFGAIFIKENDTLTDEGTVSAIQENPYMQYFLGLQSFQAEPLFDASMMVHFRKRFPVEAIAKINEYICTGKWPEEQRNVDRNDAKAEESSDDRQEPPTSGGQEKDSDRNKNTSKKKQMYNTHTHKREDRIVSLEQPHVRPISRGKRPNPTEFGQKLHLSVVDGFTFLEQTSWSNFNEGCDLIAAVQDYFRKFGCYPQAVLADKIYQTRANRTFCKEHEIRLTGPALGRRKVGEDGRKEKRQMYRDACDRNAVEGRNGNAKRRFGLDLIAAKLDETAKTEAALILTAMNAAYRLARWLLRFFQMDYIWAAFRPIAA